MSEDPLKLRRADRSWLYLKATQNFHVAPDPTPGRDGEFKVFTDYYAYTASESPDLETELLAWHWHPDAHPVTHLHVGGDARFAKMHIPTGRVLFEDVLRFLITDLGVVPKKQDWDDITGDVVKRVKAYWTWS